MSAGKLDKQRRQLVDRYGFEPQLPGEGEKLGISLNVRTGLRPLNGMRYSEEGTCGWYIWAGEEMSLDDDFFKPLHVAHIGSWAPLVLPYLILPPGWRFLIAEGYEDVWFDSEIAPASAELKT